MVNSETMLVSSVSADALTLTVVRGRGGTVAQTHGAGARGGWLRNVMDKSISQVCTFVCKACLYVYDICGAL